MAKGDLVGASADAARRAHDEGGAVVVIAPSDLHAPLVAQLDDLGAESGSAAALDAPVAVLTPVEAKGLEFDHVVLVEPAHLVTPDSAGLRLLYMSLTRATRTLMVLHAAPLPEALEPAHEPEGAR